MYYKRAQKRYLEKNVESLPFYKSCDRWIAQVFALILLVAGESGTVEAKITRFSIPS